MTGVAAPSRLAIACAAGASSSGSQVAKPEAPRLSTSQPFQTGSRMHAIWTPLGVSIFSSQTSSTVRGSRSQTTADDSSASVCTDRGRVVHIRHRVVPVCPMRCEAIDSPQLCGSIQVFEPTNSSPTNESHLTPVMPWMLSLLPPSGLACLVCCCLRGRARSPSRPAGSRVVPCRCCCRWSWCVRLSAPPCGPLFGPRACVRPPSVGPFPLVLFILLNFSL